MRRLQADAFRLYQENIQLQQMMGAAEADPFSNYY